MVNTDQDFNGFVLMGTWEHSLSAKLPRLMTLHPIYQLPISTKISTCTDMLLYIHPSVLLLVLDGNSSSTAPLHFFHLSFAASCSALLLVQLGACSCLRVYQHL